MRSKLAFFYIAGATKFAGGNQKYFGEEYEFENDGPAETSAARRTPTLRTRPVAVLHSRSCADISAATSRVVDRIGGRRVGRVLDYCAIEHRGPPDPSGHLPALGSG